MTSWEGNRKELCHLESTHLSSNPGPPLTMWSQTLPARQARSGQKNNLRFSMLKTKVIYFSLIIIMSTWIFWGFCSTSLPLGQDLNAQSSPHKTQCLFERKETHKTCIDSHSFPWKWYPFLLLMLHWLKQTTWSHLTSRGWGRQHSYMPRKKGAAAVLNSPKALCQHKYVTSVVSDSATPRTVAHQAPLSMGFSGQKYWSGLPFPSPGDLPDPGNEPRSPASQADSLSAEPPGKLWPHWASAISSITRLKDAYIIEYLMGMACGWINDSW